MTPSFPSSYTFLDPVPSPLINQAILYPTNNLNPNSTTSDPIHTTIAQHLIAYNTQPTTPYHTEPQQLPTQQSHPNSPIANPLHHTPNVSLLAHTSPPPVAHHPTNPPITPQPTYDPSDPHSCNAMYDEYNALVKNVSCDGTLSRYKARLVTKGSSQQLGVDFDETFSLVVKPATICMVLSLAMSCKWQIHQLDVKNSFLNGDLFETVNMHQPPGFVDSWYPNHVCHLQRSLYGLKQASHAWFHYFEDDIILTASSTTLLQHLIDYLHRDSILSQRKYALQLLERAHMVKCNPSRISVDTESKLGPDVVVKDPTLYRSLARGIHAEAEYQGVANVVAETSWLYNLLCELHSPLLTATLVYCDNVSAIYMSANPIQQQRIKHIEIDIHFVRDMVTAG
ncbi:ribonuclease H-like domain-containing protein [Tanacetum coccineum]